jgi:glucokinase
MSYILGLDFGGTKLAAGIVDSASGAIVAGARCPTPPGGASASLAAMLDLARDLLEDRRSRIEDRSVDPRSSILDPQLLGVGVSFNGPVAADGRTVRHSMHIPGWDDFELADRLERELSAQALIANDADAAALAEQRFGAGRGARHLLYLTISTGIGGGVIVDGRLHRGEHAWAGEVGHMPLMPGGPPCPCGRSGCLESLASGLSIARAAREQLQTRRRGTKDEGQKGRASPFALRPSSRTHSGLLSTATSQLAALAPEQITARDVAAAAAQGDELARAVWDEAMSWLGLGIAAAVNLLDPGRVVLGGGLTRAGALLFDPVRRVVAAHALDPAVEVVPAALGDDVGILGGAALMIGMAHGP